LLGSCVGQPEGGGVTGASFFARPDVEAAPLDDGVILFDPAGTKFLVLNRSAAFIWSELAAPVTSEQLASSLCATFEDVSPDAARADTRDALARMLELGIIDEKTEH
jgi:hypothetical protein